jgi:hypothetical protein
VVLAGGCKELLLDVVLVVVGSFDPSPYVDVILDVLVTYCREVDL